MPGTRRMFTRLAISDGNSFIKNDFTDIDMDLQELIDKVSEEEELNPLREVIRLYSKVLLASVIVDPDTDKGMGLLFAWLAQYAKLRNWGNKKEIKEQNKALEPFINNKCVDVQSEVSALLKSRRFVVLQGAPGTGKTFNALKISEQYDEKFLIQFHAETSYSDFVGGIRPRLNCDKLAYVYKEGVLLEAIEKAESLKNTNKRVLLIIDEINRANLSNVLGPVFYLFEDNSENRQVNLDIDGSSKLTRLPENLNVIATMNTADRSLAVVDFALRRRFAWYTIRPQKIKVGKNDNQTFHEELFNSFCEIFDRYATDEELNLQPGPSYFLTQGTDDDANNRMKDKLIYELMPLIKEYLTAGLMRKAADRFAKLFYDNTGKYLYE